MSGDFFDPTPDEQVVVLVQSATLRQEEGAQIPFDNILDRVTGSDPSVTDYILEEPAKCPNCRHEILKQPIYDGEHCMSTGRNTVNHTSALLAYQY